MGPSDADVVEPPGVAEGDGADDVGADAVVDVAGPVAGAGFGPGCVGGGGGGAVGQGPVRPAGVVEVGELVELGLQFGQGGGGFLGTEPVGKPAQATLALAETEATVADLAP